MQEASPIHSADLHLLHSFCRAVTPAGILIFSFSLQHFSLRRDLESTKVEFWVGTVVALPILIRRQDSLSWNMRGYIITRAKILESNVIPKSSPRVNEALLGSHVKSWIGQDSSFLEAQDSQIIMTFMWRVLRKYIQPFSQELKTFLTQGWVGGGNNVLHNHCPSLGLIAQ